MLVSECNLEQIGDIGANKRGADYKRIHSIKTGNRQGAEMNLFDICIVTASHSTQARAFCSLIQRRIDSGVYPREISFHVYSDPEGGRVGSGGGTLWALHQLFDELAVRPDRQADFLNRSRILMIHAAGESRRLPCYVPEGKLFAPLPLYSSAIAPPVAFDMQLTLFLKFPWRTGELVVASGDVVIDFDPDSVPDDRGDICGFAKPASVEQGARHGVFKFDRNRQHVIDFYQKKTPDFLLEHASLEGSREVALDMGIVAFSPHAVETLTAFSAADTNGKTVKESLGAGAFNFDLYLEVLTACLKNMQYDSFIQRVRNQSKLSDSMLHSIYNHFSPLVLTGAVTRKTTFAHLGSLAEYPQSCIELQNKELRPFYASETAELQPTVSHRIILHNSSNVTIGKSGFFPVYAESCDTVSIQNADGRNLFIGLRNRMLDYAVPEGICLDERQTAPSNQCTLVYSIADSFKPEKSIQDIVFCGIPIPKWLASRSLSTEDIWEQSDQAYDLLEARLFVENADNGFLQGYWDDRVGRARDWNRKFKTANRFSIKEINGLADVTKRDSFRSALRERALREQIIDGGGWFEIHSHDFQQLFENKGIPKSVFTRARQTDDDLLRAYRDRLLTHAGIVTGASSISDLLSIRYIQGICAASLHVGVKEDQIVWARSPVRLDLAGGWSDTPPYTLRAGGQVTNVAVDLNGQPPIQVFCRPTKERHICIHSIDLGQTETIRDFAALEDYSSPVSPFALPKAALCLLGLTSRAVSNQTLDRFLDTLGAGLEITLLCAVPKGSGLGTSSILGATILAALHRFFSIAHDEYELFRQVLQMEQMLTTGGGWQDQIGGAVGGVKYIECKPGYRPSPNIHQLDARLFTDSNIQCCFTLFYTGITRLAKNILQEVVDQFNDNTPSYLFTVDQVRQLAVDARSAIAHRDILHLAHIINRSWVANNLIHPSTTNEQVERLREGTKGLWRGMKLLGAGGGGYALFISENCSQAEELRARLRTDFEDRKARIVDFALNPLGLQVTVS